MSRKKDSTTGRNSMQTQQQRFANAVELEKRGEYTSALREYQAIVSKDSTFKEAYLNLGSLYSRMEQYDEAMENYHHALRLGEDYLIYFNIGSILYRKGEYKRAVLMLEKARRIQSYFPLTILVMGLCFSRLNNRKAALNCFKDVLIIAPGNRVALTALALHHYESGDYANTLYYLDKLEKTGIDNSRFQRLRADALMKDGRVDEAARVVKSMRHNSEGFRKFDTFIEAVPVEVFTDRHGSIDTKIHVLKEKVKSGGDRESLISLSLCHMLKGDMDSAMDYLFQAKKQTLH